MPTLVARKQWVNLEKDEKNIDNIRNDIERLGLDVKLRVKIDLPNTEHTFVIEHKKRIADKSDKPYEVVSNKKFTETSDDKGFIFIKDAFKLDDEENYKHNFKASSDIEQKLSAGLITSYRGTLRSYIFHKDIPLNKVADKKSQKVYTLNTYDEDVQPIKKALNALNLNVENLHIKDEVYNEDVHASVKLFQTAYEPPKGQIHPYNLPLKVDGEISDQTLMAMDEAIVNNVKFKDPHVVHFDGNKLSFIDADTGELHVCDGSGLQISGENLSRQQKHALADKMKQKISSVGKPELLKTSSLKSVASSALSENVSKKLGILSIGIIVADVVDDQEVRASHVLNATMVTASFIPVVGWMIGGSYFLADIATLTITGKSIGGYLDDEYNKHFDEPIMDFK